MTFWLPSWLRWGSLEPWQRDQYVVVLTVGVASAALELTQPFFPLYVVELGVTDPAEAAFWSGIVIGIAPMLSAVAGPFWGAMADRFGLKLMLLRALLVIAVMHAVLAFATNVYWLVILRGIMGTFAGFAPMSMALAIAVTPREKMAQAIGLVQAAQILPQALGPTVGGVIADLYGTRVNFVVTAVFLVLPLVLIYRLSTNQGFEGPPARPEGERRGPRPASRHRGGMLGSALMLLTLPGFAAGLVILFLARFTDRTVAPVLPLFLAEIDTPAAQLGTITGFVVAAGAVAAAGSSVLYGRWSRPDNTQRLLIAALLAGAVFSVLLALTTNWYQVVVLRVILGLLAGGAMSLAFTLGARFVPAERSSLALSVLSSLGQFGSATAPVLAGWISFLSFRAVFYATGVAYVLAALVAVAVAWQDVRIRRAAAGSEP